MWCKSDDEKSGLTIAPCGRTFKNMHMILYICYADGDDLSVPCQELSNNTITCKNYVYTSLHHWNKQRENVDRIIRLYKHRIEFLKVGLTNYNGVFRRNATHCITPDAIIVCVRVRACLPCVHACVCMSLLWTSGKRFEIEPSFFF